MKIKSLLIAIWLLISILFINTYYLIAYESNIVSFYLKANTFTESELEFLQSKDELVFAADPNYPPLHFINPSTGQYEGIVIDYLNALSMTLGVNIKTKPMVWHMTFDALEEGSIDFFDMHPSEERSKRFDFSLPIYYQRGAILIEKTSSLGSLDELNGKTLGAIKDDYVIEHMSQYYKDVKIIESIDLHHAIQTLKSGEVFALLGDESAMQYYIDREGLNDNYMLLEAYLYEREAVLAVRKDDKQLLNILNKGIRILNRDDTMERITRKWFGHPPLMTKNQGIKGYYFVIAYLGLMGAFLIFMFVFWTYSLKKEVALQTQAFKQSQNELRFAEKQMLQSSKMAALGQLAAGIAHEVRTPLAIIRNYTYLMGKSSMNEEQLMSLERIDSATKRANKIIDNLLNFSRISDHRIESFNLESFIRDLYLLNKKSMDDQGVEFLLEVSPNLIICVYTESLKHIIQNLFSNAIDAMPNGGKLSFLAIDEGPYVKMTIKDTGCGIEAAHLSSIYDPFFTTKSAHQGTGLGLYIVYNELLKLNGKIQVLSEVNNGTSFQIHIPKQMESQEEK